MPPILTLTLNPTVDISTSAASVTPGPKLRCAAPRHDPGGGGLNVSRAIRILGGQSLALTAAAGPTGARLMDLLGAEGIEAEAIAVPGDTRSSLAVTDEATGGQYRFVMPGPEWSPADLADFEAMIARHLTPAALVVLSGSQPPGVPPDWPERLNTLVTGRQARLIADTSGAPLRHLAAAAPSVFLLRMDAAEAEDLAGRPLTALQDSAAFAASLVASKAAETVILARGAEGSIMATATGCHVASCPVAEVVSAVGAGDSFVAGLTLALARGQPITRALVAGTAAAAAAVMTEATALCRREDAETLLARTTVAPVAPAP